MEKKIGKEFMEMTKYQNLGVYPQKEGVPMPPIELPLIRDEEIIELPDGKALALEALDLQELIEKRQSLRKYADEPLSI